MIGLINRGQLETPVQQEFENFEAKIKGVFLVEHNEDGTHITSATMLNIVPVGGIIEWATNTAPTGWILLQGQQVSRLTYKGLFDLWGTTFGAGDGSTTFNVPDSRGRVGVGKTAAGTGSTIGSTGGGVLGAGHTHTFTTASAGAHTHTGSTGSESSHTHSIPAHIHAITLDGGVLTVQSGVDFPRTSTSTGSPAGTADIFAGTGGSTTSGAGSSHAHSISSDGAHTHTGTTDTNGDPPYIIFNYIAFSGVA